MTDQIKHECGIAMIRLRKPLQYYIDKYGTPLYAVRKLYLLMEKQHNRGQDGVGVANIKIDVEPGSRYISRYRSVSDRPISDVFKKINRKFKKARKEWGSDALQDGLFLQKNVAFTGEVWLGHLRYGTHGKNSIEYCHPMLRQNNWRSRSLVMAGNFNMTNVDDLFDILVSLGQHPKEKADTVTVMEKIGHFLDQENQELFDQYKFTHTNQQITEIIEDNLNLQRVLQPLVQGLRRRLHHGRADRQRGFVRSARPRGDSACLLLRRRRGGGGGLREAAHQNGFQRALRRN